MASGDDVPRFIKTKKHEPFAHVMPDGKQVRNYQMELAAPGMKGANYIICAPTGSGKTLMASLVLSKHLRRNSTGKVVFVVNKVPLAEQQCRELSSYIPDLQSQFLTGEINARLSIRKLFQSSNLVVCTAGILLNELNKLDDQLSLSRDVTLLIIDECHNTKKNSPYTRIMELYLRSKLAGEAVPQVVGLTASPGAGDNPNIDQEKTHDHLIGLCALLDAQKGICVVQEHMNQTELIHYTHQPEFDLLKTETRQSSDKFLKLLLATMGQLEWMVKHITGEKAPFDAKLQAYENWVVRMRQESEKREGSGERDLRSLLTQLCCFHTALKMYGELNQPDAIAVLKERVKMVSSQRATEIEQTLKKIYDDFLCKAEEIGCPVENPKLIRLKQLLQEEFAVAGGNTTGIIFVTTKDTAQRMCHWLQGVPQLCDIIRPGVVTGQSKKEVGGTTLVQQDAAIKDFRKGDLNLLVATTVLEEGLDVPACNLVVRFNHVTNEIARLQTQGRARREGSHCYAILESNSPKVLQEQLNKEKGELAMEILEFLPSGDQLTAKLNRLQRDLLAKRDREVKQQAEGKTLEAYQVTLKCKRCDEVACRADQLRVVAGTHHVVVDKNFRHRLRENNTPVRKFSEEEFGMKVHCYKCEQEWGVMIKWPTKGLQYPALKCVQFMYSTPDGKVAVKQWQKAPFLVPQYEDM